MKSKIKRMLGILLAFCMMLGMMPMNASAEEAVPTYTVTFDSNGGSAVTAQSVQEGQTATEPVAPTKAGYTFMGWTRKGSPYDFSKPVTGNITLYARWGTTYDVSAIPALNTGDSMEDDDLDIYFPASSSYNYLQSTPYWRWYDTSIPNGVAVAGINYYAYAIMYLEDYSAVPYEGDFVVKYAGTELPKLNSTEIYQDNMKSGYRIYMYDANNVALQVRIYVGAPTGTGATYSIISGANGVYQKGSTADNLSFTADGDRSDFIGVEVDGSFIDVAKYDIEVDSTIVKLRKNYLESLSVGEHTLKIRYHDGAASTKFTVKDVEPAPADYAIEVSLNGYSLGAKVADASVSESSDTVDFYDFNDDGTFFCIFEDDGTGQSDWSSVVTEFEANKDYWLVVALEKQGGGKLPETELDADNATLKNGCVDKYDVYDDDLWWIEFKLTRLSDTAPGIYNITFNANGGSVTPESATTGSDGKLASLPTPTHTSPSMTFEGWYTGKTGDTKVTTDTVFTSNTTIYAHWNVDYAIEVTLNGYELGKKVADTTLVENSDSLDLDRENCHIFTEKDGEPDWSSEVTEFEADKDYWLVVALTKQGGDELTYADLSADDVDLTNDYTAELIDYDDGLWWVSYKLKPLEATTPTFDIWVGGVGMVSGDYLHEGASAVSSAAPTDSSVGYAYYNDGVLTLHNYDYSGAPALDIGGSTDYYAVYRDGDLKVVLDGENSLTLNEVSMSDSAGILADDLTVEKGSGSGKLTISGAGFGMVGDAVTINSGTFDIDVHYAAILAMMNITIKNGKYDLTAESWGCIYSYDGMVTIENGEFALASENGAGINAIAGSIHIKNGTFEIDADAGIASVSILIEGGTLTIDAECGMDVYSEEDQPTSITIKGGNLNVTAKEDGLYAWEGSIDIQGGEMEIKSTDTENDEAYAAFYADSITIADTLSVLASTVPEGSDPEVYDKTKNSTYDWIKTGPIVQTTYNVTVENGSGDGEYTAGTTVTIEAEELDGKLFREWTSQDGVTFADSKSAATTFTMLGKDVTVTATYDTIVTVIDISGITPPVVGEMPNDSFVVSTPGVELGAEIFWSRYEEATNKLIQTYEDDKLVNNEPFRAGYYVKLQTEVWAKEGYVFTPDTIIRYNGVELPVMDNTDLKPNFRYPILDARKYRTAASIGWEVVEAEPVDIQIPVTKVVQKGGNTDFSGRETFRFAVEVLNSNVDAGALSIIGDTMIVTDKNGQETVITITVPGEMFADVIDEGFLITEIKGTAQGWTYDETQWIAVYDEETGWKFVPYDELFGDVEPEFQDEVTFTNIYTKNVEEPKQEESKPSAPAVNPQNPPTGDNSHVGLWISLMFASMLCAAAVVFGKKRFSVK